MGIDRVYFGYLNIKCFCSLLDDKINSRYSDRSFADNVCYSVYGAVKGISEGVCEIVYKSLSAAVFRIFPCIFRRVFWNAGQKACSRSVVSNEYTADLKLLQVIGKLLTVVKKAGRLGENSIFLRAAYYSI